MLSRLGSLSPTRRATTDTRTRESARAFWHAHNLRTSIALSSRTVHPSRRCHATRSHWRTYGGLSGALASARCGRLRRTHTHQQEKSPPLLSQTSSARIRRRKLAISWFMKIKLCWLASVMKSGSCCLNKWCR